jgi:hypothetical protein
MNNQEKGLLYEKYVKDFIIQNLVKMPIYGMNVLKIF